MRIRSLHYTLGLLCVAIASGTVQAAEPLPDPYALAARLDQHIETGWRANKAVPAPLATDAEFIRRVYLDVAGRIPRVSETRAFLDDKDPNKRRKLVEKLLESSQYVTNFTNTWRGHVAAQQ